MVKTKKLTYKMVRIFKSIFGKKNNLKFEITSKKFPSIKQIVSDLRRRRRHGQAEGSSERGVQEQVRKGKNRHFQVGSR